MDINIRNVSAFSQATPEGLNSVTDGLNASVDARGIIAVDNAIQSFGEGSVTPLDPTVTSNIGEAGSVTGPYYYFKHADSKHALEPGPGANTQTPLLTILQDPNFKINDSLSAFANNVFGSDGGVGDLASQLGINGNLDQTAAASDLSSGNPLDSSLTYPGSLDGSITGSGFNEDNPLAASFPERMPEEAPLMDATPLNSAIQLSDLTSENPLESSIPVSSGLQNSTSLQHDGSPFSDIDGIHVTEPRTESPAGQFEVEDYSFDIENSLNLLQNNFSKVQNLGTTVNQQLALQQDLTERRGS